MYHVNPKTGNAGPCKAQMGQCPFGSEDEHFNTSLEARAAYENRMEQKVFQRVSYWHAKPWQERKLVIASEVEKIAGYYSMGEVKTLWVQGDNFLARASQNNHSIEFSERLEFLEREKIQNTIVHELAHLRVGKGKGHGKEWLALASKMAEDQDLALKDFENSYKLSRAEQLRLVSSQISNANAGFVASCARGHLEYTEHCPNGMMGCHVCIDEGIARRDTLLRYSPVNRSQKLSPSYMAKARQNNIEAQAAGTFEDVRKILSDW